MQNISAWRIKQRSLGLDWSFLSGSALLSIGMAVARAMGLAFSLLLAATFLPGEYGSFQYSLTLALIFSVVTQPFGQHVVARFVALCKNDSEQLKSTLTNSWLVLGVLFVLTLVVVIPIMTMLDTLDVGSLVVILGVTVFYAYWGLSRGFLASGRLTIAFLASNLVQILAAFLLIYVLKLQSATLALLIYGLSYFLPLALLQYYQPLPFYFEPVRISKSIIKKLIRFSWSIWMSHAAFMFVISIDIILLEMFSGVQAVGVYAATKTTSTVFMFIPMAIATLIMPKAAVLSRAESFLLMKKALAISIAINILGFVIYLLLIRWFVGTMFGSEYVVDMSIYFTMALGTIIYSTGAIVAAVLVGTGSPQYEAISNIVGLITITLAGLLLIPAYGIMGATLTTAIGGLGTVTFYAIVAMKVIKNP